MSIEGQAPHIKSVWSGGLVATIADVPILDVAFDDHQVLSLFLQNLSRICLSCVHIIDLCIHIQYNKILERK